jgi:hypothetical protein
MFAVGDLAMLPDLKPYPRFGRIAAIEPDGSARVVAIRCGDPRCAAEHNHGAETWSAATVLAARAYQPRAGWETGRLSSPNTPVD